MSEARYKAMLAIRHRFNQQIASAARAYAVETNNDHKGWDFDDIYYLDESGVELRYNQHICLGRYEDYQIFVPLQFVLDHKQEQ